MCIRDRLKKDWSPEIIANKIGQDIRGASISHEAIYQYIYHPKTQGRDKLIGQLVRGHAKRKKKGIGRKERKAKIPSRISINERPVSADNRSRYGHWEGDSLVSRKSLVALNSLVERKSRLLMLTRLDRKTAEQTWDAVVQRLHELPERARRTLTLDNGTENSGHEQITESLGTQCYFADPYSSWQRGANEQVNGMVRRYFPKGTDFSKITDEQVGTTRTEWHGWNHVLMADPGNAWAIKLQQKSLLLHLLLECGTLMNMDISRFTALQIPPSTPRASGQNPLYRQQVAQRLSLPHNNRLIKRKRKPAPVLRDTKFKGTHRVLKPELKLKQSIAIHAPGL
ncbi:MAG TPA: IS30 family transposase [Nitrospirae bacterium]|nr:IS30 family transposase [Nitrospirota bacterium]